MYQEYFDVGETPAEPAPTPPTEPEQPEEKKDNFPQVLQDMILGLNEIPEGLTKEKIIEILKEHKQAEKEMAERTIRETKEKEMSEEAKKQFEMLTAKRPQKDANFLDSDEVKANRSNWNALQKSRSDYEQNRLNKLKENMPDIGLKNPLTREGLEKMSLDQRTQVFEKLGLVSKGKKFMTEKK